MSGKWLVSRVFLACCIISKKSAAVYDLCLLLADRFGLINSKLVKIKYLITMIPLSWIFLISYSYMFDGVAPNCL